MKYIARDFLAHCYAGLVLAGQTSEGEPEWIGTEKEWNKVEFYKNADLETEGANNH